MRLFPTKPIDLTFNNPLTNVLKSAFSHIVPVLEHVTLGARDLPVCDFPFTDGWESSMDRNTPRLSQYMESVFLHYCIISTTCSSN